MLNFKSWRAALAAAVIALSGGAALSDARAQTIVDIAANDDRFETLVAAVTAAGLAETLQGPGPFTVFAPTDDAFAQLEPGLLEDLLKPENKGTLTDILLYHVDDRFLPSSFLPHRTIPIRPILSQNVLCVTLGRGGVTIGDSQPVPANVIIADIEASNGVIHVVDRVLIPGRTRCGH